MQAVEEFMSKGLTGLTGLYPEDVARPERLEMYLQELVPRAVPALRAQLEAVLLQDILHRVAADVGDAELLQLAQDAGVAPAILSREAAGRYLACPLAAEASMIRFGGGPGWCPAPDERGNLSCPRDSRLGAARR